jgi:signal transduction histidine kinase
LSAKVKIYLEIIPGAAAWGTLVQKLQNLTPKARAGVVCIYNHIEELEAFKALGEGFKAPICLQTSGAVAAILEQQPTLVILPCLVNPLLTHEEYAIFQNKLEILLNNSFAFEATLPMVAYEGVNDVLHPPLHWPREASVNRMFLRQHVIDYHVCDIPPQMVLNRYVAGELEWPFGQPRNTPEPTLNLANLHRLREAMFSLVTAHAGDLARQLSLRNHEAGTHALTWAAYLPSPLGWCVVTAMVGLGVLASRSAWLPISPWVFILLFGGLLVGLAWAHVRTIWAARQKTKENYTHALLRLVYDVSYLDKAEDILSTALEILRRGLGIHVVYGSIEHNHVSLMDNVKLSDVDFDSMTQALQSGYVTAPPESETHGYIWCPVQTGQVMLGVLGVRHSNGHSLYQTYALTNFLRTFTRFLAGAVWRIELDKEKTNAAFLANRESLRSSLLSSVSHDLKTPLVSVIGGLSTLLLHKDKLTQKARQELIHTAYTEAQRLQKIVNNVLDMAGMESGTMVLRKTLIDLAETISATATRVQAAYPGLNITLENTLQHVGVKGDELLLSQVVYNLLENAAKYGPKRPRVRIKLSGPDEHNLLLLQFIDNGQGVPSTELPKIFDKFYRSSFTDKKPAGSGLGLAICRAIIEAHGGTIMAYTKPDHKPGLMVSVLLPAIELILAPEPAMKAPQHDQ